MQCFDVIAVPEDKLTNIADSEIGLELHMDLMNRLKKKFMQIGVDVTCMYTNFGGRDHSSFGDTATLKNSQISLSDHGL